MDIGISRQVTAVELQASLRRHLPGVRVLTTGTLSVLDSKPGPFLLLDEGPVGFPIGVTTGIEIEEGLSFQHWLIELARVLSIDIGCQTLCDGSGFGDDDSPFWSIVWDRGVAYLGDDSAMDPSESEDGSVRIIRALGRLDLEIGPGALGRVICRPA